MRKTLVGTLLLFAVSPLCAQCIGTVGVTNDAALIQAKLNSGQSAILCPSTVWAVNQTLTFPIQYDDIYVYTEGNPRDDTRALLYVNNSGIAAVFAANGWDVQSGTIVAPDNVQLRNLRIDGGIDRFGSCGGQACYNQALIHFGGPTSGQIVDSVKAWGARGWSTIVFERGVSAYSNGCSYGQITNNELGPSGYFATGQYADGISLQCSNSDVLFNLIQDVTDGGIVIFGAPGSTIRYNDIRANTQSAISGIAMVDQWGTNDGNFSGTQVFGNTITANAFMKFGIAMGYKLFCQPNVDLYNWGGSVTGNTLQGSRMGYGYVADGVTDWTVTGNVDNSQHVGTPVSQCDCTLPAPRGFIRHMGAHTDSSTTFQPEFTNGCLHGADIHP
ncbi:MAG TPA: hypothetical protein VFE33_23225 [Thermoanaerobaculia bacterium]|nr:hypothetical protein [Thermoanaerobaculia bacterium]